VSAKRQLDRTRPRAPNDSFDRAARTEGQLDRAHAAACGDRGLGLGHKLGDDRAVCTSLMHDAQFHNDFTSGRCELLR